MHVLVSQDLQVLAHLLELLEQTRHLKLLPNSTILCAEVSTMLAMEACFALGKGAFFSYRILSTWEIIILANLSWIRFTNFVRNKTCEELLGAS